MLGTFITSLKPAAILSMTGRGVPRGTPYPYQGTTLIHLCFRRYFMKQLKPLRLKRNAQPTYTCDIAAGSVHRGGEAVLHRVTASLKDHRYHRGSRFDRETRSGSADSGDHGNLAANQITREIRQSIILSLRPAVLDRRVLALDKTAFLETLAERIQLRLRRVG